jgi:hypothetical protein
MIGLKFRGRPAINIAKTVRDIAHFNNEYANAIMDRSQVINEELIGAIIAQGVMSYAGREPQPALDEDGNFQCTDLDLLSFLSPIADRGAVIEIPRYRNRRQIIRREGERKIGNNQFGPITSLVSNKEVFSFSVKIHDKTIVTKNPETGREEVGAFRNYMLVDCDGHWYDGWNKIVWDPNAEENAFLRDHRLWTGNTVYFQYYVHPARWQSVFGAPHLLKKMLITRLEDEASYYKKEMNRLLEAGIKFPGNGNDSKASFPVIEAGETMPIKVQTMDMILSVPEFIGSYPAVPKTPEGLAMAYCRQKLLTYNLKPAVQFVVRANEAAYLLYGFDSRGAGRIAPWLSTREWKPWKNTPRSSEYQSLVLSNDMALMYRVKTKTERVSAE